MKNALQIVQDTMGMADDDAFEHVATAVKGQDLEEITLLNRQFSELRELVKRAARALQPALDKLAAEEAIRRKLGNLSDAERKALAQAVKPKGIESAEKMGRV